MPHTECLCAIFIQSAYSAASIARRYSRRCFMTMPGFRREISISAFTFFTHAHTSSSRFIALVRLVRCIDCRWERYAACFEIIDDMPRLRHSRAYAMIDFSFRDDEKPLWRNTAINAHTHCQAILRDFHHFRWASWTRREWCRFSPLLHALPRPGRSWYAELSPLLTFRNDTQWALWWRLPHFFASLTAFICFGQRRVGRWRKSPRRAAILPLTHGMKWLSGIDALDESLKLWRQHCQSAVKQNLLK